MGKTQTELFLKNKIKRQICINGQKFNFKKTILDEFNQKKLTDEVVEVDGIFHESVSYIKSKNSEPARLVTKPQPMILVLFEDGEKIEKDFVLEFSGNEYVVSEKHNIKGLNVAFDISLEVVL